MSEAENVRRIGVEKNIVRHLIREAAKVGFRPVYVFDGGEYVKVASEKASLETVFSVDEATITFQGPNGKRVGVLLVLGNGYDVIADYNPFPAFEPAMEATMQYVERMQYSDRVLRNPGRRAFQSGRKLRVKKSSASEAYRTRLAVDPRRARRVLRRSGYRVNPEPGRYMHAYKALREAFGAEWDKLSNTDAALVGRDYLEAVEKDNIDSREYARRIGRGNLQSYAEVMRVREKKGWNRNPRNPMRRREIVTITSKRTGRIYAYMKPDATRAEIGRAALMLANEHSEPVKVERVPVRTRSLPAMPEKVRAYLANPAPRPNIAAAARRFQRFTGHRADRVENVPFPSNPGAGLAVGPVLMLGYSATRDGKTENYLHKFRGKSRPTLVASHDGKQLILVGGRFRFTERGIVDK